jgi:transcriptional regulator
MDGQKAEVLQGTLDLLILRTLALEAMHGFGISRRIEQLTQGVLQVNPGTFFPALYRLEEKGWIRGAWGKSENNRRAKYYTLTDTGRRQMQLETDNWNRVSLAILRVLEAT